jgi:hypothetical protein
MASTHAFVKHTKLRHYFSTINKEKQLVLVTFITIWQSYDTHPHLQDFIRAVI